MATTLYDQFGNAVGTLTNPLITEDASRVPTLPQDFSINKTNYGSLSLLQTVLPNSQVTSNLQRVGGYIIQNQSPNVAVVVFDDGGGNNLSQVILMPAIASGYPGGSIDSSSGIFTGRIQVYGVTGSEICIRVW